MGIPTLLALCLLLLPLYASPLEQTAKGAGSGMGATPPAVLESYRSFGSWTSAERRILVGTPFSYRLEVPTLQDASPRLSRKRAPDLTMDTLALQGQRRLEGG